MLSASALYREAAGLAPAASGTVTEPSHCIMCAAPLAVGMPGSRVTKKTFDDAFNNKADLRAPSGTYVCGDCEVLWAKDWMQKYSKTYACREGVFKFASNEDKAGFFLDPPEPPFAAIFSTRQQQHMIWRTPVSLSREFFIVRVDSELLTIRRSHLIRAWHDYRRVEAIMAETPLAASGRKLNPPAALIAADLGSTQMGALRLDVLALLEQVGETALGERLHQLTMGEWWALGVIRSFDPASPPGRVNAITGEIVAPSAQAA